MPTSTEREWSDGLPIVPPTIEKIEEFLSYTERDPAQSLGILLPENRAGRCGPTAVNGVMAGCRPQYMPILLPSSKPLAIPIYGVEPQRQHSGRKPLIVLKRADIKELKFNYEQGVLRDGFMANTSSAAFGGLRCATWPASCPTRPTRGTFPGTLSEWCSRRTRTCWPDRLATEQRRYGFLRRGQHGRQYPVDGGGGFS